MGVDNYFCLVCLRYGVVIGDMILVDRELGRGEERGGYECCVREVVNEG